MLLDFVNSKKNDIGQRIYHFQNRESSREAQAKNRYRKTIKTKWNRDIDFVKRRYLLLALVLCRERYKNMIYVNLSRKHMKCAKKFWTHVAHSRLVKITSERSEAMWNVICIFFLSSKSLFEKKLIKKYMAIKINACFYVISAFPIFISNSAFSLLIFFFSRLFWRPHSSETWTVLK